MEILSAGNGMSPAWSPHGDQIAFMSNRTEGWHLYTMRADGSDVQRLTAGPSPDSPSWSPDGAQLAFERDGQIEAIRADGSERRILPTGIEACAQPVWCPDGERIAFVADGGIWAIAFDDEESRPLTGGDGESQPMMKRATSLRRFGR